MSKVPPPNPVIFGEESAWNTGIPCRVCSGAIIAWFENKLHWYKCVDCERSGTWLDFVGAKKVKKRWG